MKQNQAFKIILVVCGTICVGLALLGVFLPILPTTPFLLLAAFFYARSSERFYAWLIGNRWSGPIIQNYREGRGLPLKQKILTIALLWLSIGYTVVFVTDTLWLRIGLAGIATGVTINLIRKKTYKAPQDDVTSGRVHPHPEQSPE